MQVFKPSSPADQEWVVLLDKAFREMLSNLDGTSRRDSWSPPPVRVLKSSERKRLKYSDLPHFSGHVLVLREPAVDALGELLSPDGELLPLDCVDAPLWLFNCRRVVDALDEEHSQLVRFPSTGRIMLVDSFAFRPEPLLGVNAFKVPQLVRSSLFVTSELVAAAHRANLARTDFQLVWED
jgi:hypothetical protein